MQNQRERKFMKELSPKDDRDYSLDKVLTMVSANSNIKASTPKPANFKLPYFGKIKDQGNIGSCVAHSLAYERETIQFYEYLMEKYEYCSFPQLLQDLAIGKLIPTEEDLTHYIEFSVGFVYGNREELITETRDGEGMYTRDAIKGLVNTGNVYLLDFPENDKYINVRPLFLQRQSVLLSKASPNKVTAYALLETIDDVKTALMNLGTITVVIPILDSFFKTGADGLIPMPDRANETLAGYHAMTIFGWREDNTFDILNSWSNFWGELGWGHIPFNFFDSTINQTYTEMWSITDIPVPVVPPVIVVPPVVVPPIVVPIENKFIVILKKILKFIIGLFKK